MDKVLTVEFRYLGHETAITIAGNASLSWALCKKLHPHLNKDTLLVDREESRKLFNLYEAQSKFGQTKRGDSGTMFYYIER